MKKDRNRKSRQLNSIDNWKTCQVGSVRFIIGHFISANEDLGELKPFTLTIKHIVGVGKHGDNQVKHNDVEHYKQTDGEHNSNQPFLIRFYVLINFEIIVSKLRVEHGEDCVEEIFVAIQVDHEVNVSYDGEH